MESLHLRLGESDPGIRRGRLTGVGRNDDVSLGLVGIDVLRPVDEDQSRAQRGARRPETREIADCEGERRYLLLQPGTRPEGDRMQGGVDRRVGDLRVSGRRLDRDEPRLIRPVEHDDPFAIGLALDWLRAFDEKTMDAVDVDVIGRRGAEPRDEHRPLRVDLRKGFLRQFGDDDRGGAVLEPVEGGGDMHAGGGLETDAAGRREDRCRPRRNGHGDR